MIAQDDNGNREIYEVKRYGEYREARGILRHLIGCYIGTRGSLTVMTTSPNPCTVLPFLCIILMATLYSR